MHRIEALWAACAMLLVLAAPLLAGDADLREEVERLREKVEALEAQQTTLIADEVEEYLASQSPLRGAQGGENQDRITIHAAVTGVFQGTVGLDPSNRSVVGGDYSLDFDFQVTDDLSLFLHMVGNGFDEGGSDGTFPSQFGTVVVGSPPQTFNPIAGPTLSGLFDGIGVNGNTPTAPGVATMYEAGFRFTCRVGETTLHHEFGELDPRTRFLQNDIADDAKTQYLNDLFANPPAVEWLTDATGRTSYAYYGWLNLGSNGEWTISYGWFNTPGQWFNHGQFYIQGGWKGEVGGHVMNVRVLAWVQSFFRDASGDGSSGGGVSWDWFVTDKVGLWARIAVNGGDANPVEADYSFGAVWNGPFARRPDDQVGAALGFISANTTVLPGIPEDTEVTIEIYYKLMLEGGKLQITPDLMIVLDPGGGLPPWQDDVLFILGVRVHVPF
ncbi:MAG TPA: carbohydrate porin [Planctomycetota bacterium]|nr:carbohydrate porin [Planctomycetota bacterium]